MRAQSSSGSGLEGAARLKSLAPLSAAELDALSHAQAVPVRAQPGQELAAEGQPIGDPRLLLSGWACRTRIFSDGRRQILGFLLPGDVIGSIHDRKTASQSALSALSEVWLCRAPEPERRGSGLDSAYVRAAAAEQFYLLRQVGRLGRMSAYERMVDLLLELHERLGAAGLIKEDAFAFPVTQEALADALGLTSVHVNRTLQGLRREGVLELRSGVARLNAVESLRARVDFKPAPIWG